MTFRWGCKQRDDIGRHPRGPHLGGQTIEHLCVLTKNDEDEVIRCSLDDVKAQKSFDRSRLRDNLGFSSGKETRIWRLPKVQVIHDGGWHGLRGYGRLVKSSRPYAMCHYIAPGGSADPPTNVTWA